MSPIVVGVGARGGGAQGRPTGGDLNLRQRGSSSLERCES